MGQCNVRCQSTTSIDVTEMMHETPRAQRSPAQRRASGDGAVRETRSQSPTPLLPDCDGRVARSERLPLESHDNEWTGIAGRGPQHPWDGAMYIVNLPRRLTYRSYSRLRYMRYTYSVTPMLVPAHSLTCVHVRKQPFPEWSPIPELGNAVRYTTTKQHSTSSHMRLIS